MSRRSLRSLRFIVVTLFDLASAPRRRSCTAVSACSRVSTSGGEKRIAFLPAPSTSSPRLNAAVDDGVALVGRALLRLPIAHQLDADHQPAAAHVADQRMLVRQRLQARHQVRADVGGVRDQLILAAA